MFHEIDIEVVQGLVKVLRLSNTLASQSDPRLGLYHVPQDICYVQGPETPRESLIVN